MLLLFSHLRRLLNGLACSSWRRCQPSGRISSSRRQGLSCVMQLNRKFINDSFSEGFSSGKKRTPKPNLDIRAVRLECTGKYSRPYEGLLFSSLEETYKSDSKGG